MKDTIRYWFEHWHKRNRTADREQAWRGWEAGVQHYKPIWFSTVHRMPRKNQLVVLRDDNTTMNSIRPGETMWHGVGFLAGEGIHQYWSVIGAPRGVTLDSVTHWQILQ